MPSRTTIHDVGRRAGVSVGTVSKALNGSANVAEATRRRIVDAAAELDYRPNRAARSLVGQRSFLIGYELPRTGEWGNPTLDSFLHSLVGAADQHGLEIVLFHASDNDGPSGYADLMRRGAVDGFVLTGTNYEDKRVDALLTAGFPFVTFGRTARSAAHNWVDVDGAAGTAAAVAHLHRLGHRHIGMIAWPDGSETGDSRVQGLVNATARLGLPDPTIIRATTSVQEGVRAFGELMRRAPDTTAIVAVQDELALGAHREARRQGLIPGSDIAIVGFDDIPAASFVEPSLSSIRQPFELIGSRLVEILARAVRYPGEPEGVLVEPELVVRESS